MSQAVGLRLLDVTRFFFFLVYKWPALQHPRGKTHTHAALWASWGFSVLHLNSFATDKASEEEKETHERERKKSTVVNFVALCVVSVGQASDQCWGSVCVWVCVGGCLRHIAPVIQQLNAHISLNTMFCVDTPENRWKTRRWSERNYVKQIYLTADSYLNGVDCGVCMRARCLYVHT